MSIIGNLFILFSRELTYSFQDHPVNSGQSKSTLPDKPQSFSATFIGGQEISGDCAISIIDKNALHIFKVKSNLTSTRIYTTMDSLKKYKICDQLGTILKNNNDITDDDLKQGLEEQLRIRNRPLGEYLKDKGIVSNDALEKALSEQGKWPKIRLGELLLNEGLITKEQLDEALEVQKKNRVRRLGEILISIGATTEHAVHSALAQKLIVRLVQRLLVESIRRNASDIHIRPTAKGVQVLYRIHGKLTNIRSYGKSLLAPIVARIRLVTCLLFSKQV
jgi:type II secretory ATPase GspE/PulE/Tfp pilus assembly ATPase PilB-like protein